MQGAVLLIVDAAVNLALGLALLLYPRSLAQWLGVPIASTAFYPSILGGVLIGISLALFLERYRHLVGLAGLGTGGALVINLCGAGTLVAWLLCGHLHLSIRGYLVLWALAALVLGIGALELLGEIRRDRRPISGLRG